MARRETRRYQDRREANIKAVAKRRKKVRQMAIDYKGGSCKLCGYVKCLDALEFHHLDPLQKDFAISQYGHSRSWQRVQKELDKCVMLCANCHREVHAGMQLPQVTAVEKWVNSGNPTSPPEDKGILSQASQYKGGRKVQRLGSDERIISPRAPTTLHSFGEGG